MIKITNEDNMLLMGRYPDNYFDLAIVDVPYGLGEAAGKNASRNKGFGSGVNKSKKVCLSKDYGNKSWDEKAPDKSYFIELKRISKNQIIWGANHFIQNIPNANSPGWIVWDKDNGDSDFADCELAYSSFDKAVRKVKIRWNGMLQHDMKNKEIRIHETQKPVKLYEWIFAKYAKENDKIVDTNIGSGSIVIALDRMNKIEKMNLSIVGCELDFEHYTNAKKRIKRETAQQTIF